MSGGQTGRRVNAGEQALSLKAVDALISRVQRLVDSRSGFEDRLAWEVEAYYLGDMSAIAALAELANRAADQQILIVREFHQPRDLVFGAWTTPELVKRWWGGRLGEVTSAEIDLRVGGKWRYVLVEDNGRSAFHGEYREIVANERIVSTHVDEVGRANR